MADEVVVSQAGGKRRVDDPRHRWHVWHAASLQRDELCKLMIKDIHERQGVKHWRVHGKGVKVRHVPLHPGSQEKINEYLQAAGHGGIPSVPLFKPIRNNRRGTTDTALTTDGAYQLIKIYGQLRQNWCVLLAARSVPFLSTRNGRKVGCNSVKH